MHFRLEHSRDRTPRRISTLANAVRGIAQVPIVEICLGSRPPGLLNVNAPTGFDSMFRRPSIKAVAMRCSRYLHQNSAIDFVGLFLCIFLMHKKIASKPQHFRGVAADILSAEVLKCFNTRTVATTWLPRSKQRPRARGQAAPVGLFACANTAATRARNTNAHARHVCTGRPADPSQGVDERAALDREGATHRGFRVISGRLCQRRYPCSASRAERSHRR